MSDAIKEFVITETEHVLETLRELCHIPAPSHSEEKRAKFCKKFLEEHGARGVYIDEAKNVIFPLGCEESEEITVIAAHTDTVFPDTEPMPMSEDEERIYCPGVWDDSVAVAVLLHTAVYFVREGIVPEKGIMFVCNSCEEGLGNLKGTKTLMESYKGRISRFISFDSMSRSMVNRAVGSRRFEVEITTEGGHSFGAFGNTNAIAVMADMITRIYETEVPDIEGTKTTYNVGVIEGGTSVNTIAQSVKMLCEYRSDDYECLEIMNKRFLEIFSAPYNADVTVTLVGERPCGSRVCHEKQSELEDICQNVIFSVSGIRPVLDSGSTDCNVPLSMGIPSVCFGVSEGKYAHTRGEWVKKSSVSDGLEIALKTALALSEL